MGLIDHYATIICQAPWIGPQIVIDFLIERAPESFLQYSLFLLHFDLSESRRSELVTRFELLLALVEVVCIVCFVNYVLLERRHAL